jgi:1-acyl-sn-glycerol-3-phosphate acyltransferase
MYWSGWTLFRLISTLFFRVKITGQEHVPKKGGFILASNHRSYADPPVVGSSFRREYFSFAKRELFEKKLFAWWLRGVNSIPVRRGAVDRETIKFAVDVINRGYGLTFFPEGTRSKTDDFLPAKPGIGMIAIRARCPIVPVYIDGSNHLLDCFLFKRRLKVRYGAPLTVDWLDSFEPGKEAYQQVAQQVIDRIKQLQQEVRGS